MVKTTEVFDAAGPSGCMEFAENNDCHLHHILGAQGKNASNQFLILHMTEHTCVRILFNHAMILQVI